MTDPILKGWVRLLDLIVHLLPVQAPGVSGALRTFHAFDSPKDQENFVEFRNRVRCPLTGVEVGVSKGWTSELLLRTFLRLHLFMVDYWDCAAKGSNYAKSGDGHAALNREQQAKHRRTAEERTAFAADRRTILAMDSIEAAQIVPDETLDFAFIDGDHTYSGVKRDMEAWWPKVKPGRLLVGHDYQHPRDKRGLWGVTKAATEFCLQHAVKFHGDARANVWWCEKP